MTLKHVVTESAHIVLQRPKAALSAEGSTTAQTRDERGRLIRAAKIFAMADVAFGDHDLAIKWLNKPRKAIGDMSALDAMQTEAGAILVEEVLGQIDSGYFA